MVCEIKFGAKILPVYSPLKVTGDSFIIHKLAHY